MKEVNNYPILNWLKTTIKIIWPFILLFIGILLCIVGFTKIVNNEIVISTEYDTFREICRWSGNLLIVGVLIGFLSSYFQFNNIYRDSLEEVIYSPTFLAKRKDIDKIWESVSNVLFDLKFPDISEQLFSALKNKYFPTSQDYYQENRVIKLTIDWVTEDKKWISVTQEDDFQLVTATKKEVDFKLNGTIVLSESEPDDEECDNKHENYHKINKVTLNDRLLSPSEENGSGTYYFKYRIANGLFHSLLSIKLKDALRYKINLNTSKHQSLDHDDYIGLYAQTTINNLRLQVFNNISDDISINFIPRGVLNNFICNKKTLNYFEYEYKGLILHKQGYILTIRPNR